MRTVSSLCRNRLQRRAFVVVAFLLALPLSGGLLAPAPASGQDMIQPVGPVERVRDGFEFTEGPAYDPAGVLYFSDIPANKIYAMDDAGEFSVFTDDSSHTNGIVYVTSGKYAHKLIACQMDGRIALYHSSTGRADVLADSFEGKRFNAPNDLVVDTHDGIYFTDPFFRAPQPLPQEIQAVYYRTGDGAVSRITGHIAAPNGIALSPDGTRLYVIPTMQAEMLVYEITAPGKVGEPQVFCTLRQPEGKSGTGGDGMAVDQQGNLYITSSLGVQIFSPAGEYRGLVETPEQPANVTFGGPQLKTLYITARTGLYRAEMPIAGLRPN